VSQQITGFSWSSLYHSTFPERTPAGLRRRVELRTFFLADFETDGLRAERGLHHERADSSGDFSPYFGINKFACANLAVIARQPDRRDFSLAAVLSTGSRALTARELAAPETG
jgi:hypothetical protein